MASRLLECQSLIKVEDDIVHLFLGHNFCKYYISLIDKEIPEFEKYFHPPKNGAHVTVLRKPFDPDWSAAKFLHNARVPVYYDPTDIGIGGFRAGTFFNLYFQSVKSIYTKTIRNLVGLRDLKKLHITIANSKNREVPERVKSRLLKRFPKPKK